jgi:hypothetical protein
MALGVKPEAGVEEVTESGVLDADQALEEPSNAKLALILGRMWVIISSQKITMLVIDIF